MPTKKLSSVNSEEDKSKDVRLLSLIEILNLDAISMAMKELEEARLREERLKFMANDSGEDVFVEENITFSGCPDNICKDIGFIEEVDSDDSDDGQDDYVSNDAANRRAIAMMMSG